MRHKNATRPARKRSSRPSLHAGPAGGYSYCGGYFAPPPGDDGSVPEPTCKRCISYLAKRDAQDVPPEYNQIFLDHVEDLLA